MSMLIDVRSAVRSHECWTVSTCSAASVWTDCFSRTRTKTMRTSAEMETLDRQCFGDGGSREDELQGDSSEH